MFGLGLLKYIGLIMLLISTAIDDGSGKHVHVKIDLEDSKGGF